MCGKFLNEDQANNDTLNPEVKRDRSSSASSKKSNRSKNQSKKRRHSNSKGTIKTRLFPSGQYTQICQTDLDFFLYQQAQTKIYGSTLIDVYGKVIFMTKTARQHFEGSLNNYQKINFMDIIIQKQRNQVLKKLRQIEYNHVQKIIMYSKNIKRRYSNTFTSISDLKDIDIYYKYLKCLVIRSRPIKLSGDANIKQKIPGAWTGQLPDLLGTQLLLIQSKMATQIPDLSKYDLHNDPMILKFDESGLKKAERNSQSQTIIGKPPLSKKIQKKQQNKYIQIYTQQEIDKYIQENLQRYIKLQQGAQLSKHEDVLHPIQDRYLSQFLKSQNSYKS